MKQFKSSGLCAIALLTLAMLCAAAAPTSVSAQAKTKADATAATKQQKSEAAPQGAASDSAPFPRPSVEKEQSTKPQPKTWNVRITQQGEQKFVTLKAQNAPVADIVADISNQVKIPIVVSEMVKPLRVTYDFKNIALEQALRMLAPAGFMETSLSGDYSKPAQVLVVYLSALNEEPTREAIRAVGKASHSEIRSRNTLVVVSGDTEAPTDNPARDRAKKLFEKGDLETLEKEAPIKVTYDADKGRLTVRANKQPLSAVAHEIGNRIGVPVILADSVDSTSHNELVDVNILDYNVEDAVRSLSPNVRLHVRTDLLTNVSSPLRIVLAEPAAGKAARN